jgi:hypothetical protein
MARGRRRLRGAASCDALTPSLKIASLTASAIGTLAGFSRAPMRRSRQAFMPLEPAFWRFAILRFVFDLRLAIGDWRLAIGDL